MSILEAIILGIVQGLAEFLPVSSSGHLQIAKEALGVTLTDNLTFDIMLHVATVLATIVVLWPEVKRLIAGVFVSKISQITSYVSNNWMTPERTYVAKLLLSMVPVATVGLLLGDRLNEMLASPAILLIVGVLLVVTAGLLVIAERVGRRQKECSKAISWRDAFIIGLAQAAAAMPGLSRSGSTIATGLILNNKRAAVAQFSFLMVIAPILGEALLDVLRGAFGASGTDGVNSLGVSMLPLAAGFLSAFLVGCAACRFMIEMVKRSKLIWFALYCAIVGVATIIWWMA